MREVVETYGPKIERQVGEKVYSVTEGKIVETTVVGGKVVDIKEHKPPEGYVFNREIIEETLGKEGRVALKTENLTTIRVPITADIPLSATITDFGYKKKLEK
jgi:hypothetical protein